MDKKAKKRLEVARKRLQKLQAQISGARQQNDEPELVARLEEEIQKTQADIEKLKAS